jgi:hypothetical protein
MTSGVDFTTGRSPPRGLVGWDRRQLAASADRELALVMLRLGVGPALRQMPMALFRTMIASGTRAGA